MADDRPASEVASAARCPWCSAPLESTGAATCPSCGATLSADSEPQLPGVTTVAPSSISRTAQRRPNRIVQWITGDSGEAPAPPVAAAAPGSLTPPAADVRVEMLRLELAARLADRTAEIEALETEARLEAAPDASLSQAGGAATEHEGEERDVPVSENQRPSTWAELDDAHGGGRQSADAGPSAAVLPEATPDDSAAARPDAGPDEPAESTERKA